MMHSKHPVLADYYDARKLIPGGITGIIKK